MMEITVDEAEEAKRVTLASLFHSLQVAKVQHTAWIEKFKEVYPWIKFGEYDTHSHKFLLITKSVEEADFWYVICHLKSYVALLGHMIQENQNDEEYRQFLCEAKNNLRQILEWVTRLTYFTTEGHDVIDDAGDPVLPDELKLENRSQRLMRDILTIRDYGKSLNFIENVLVRYREQ